MYMSDVLLNKGAAESFFTALISKINLLCSFPNIGKDVENDSIIEKETKRINVKSYYLYYYFEENNKTIWILELSIKNVMLIQSLKKGSLN